MMVDSGRIRVVYLDHCAQLSGAEIGLVRLLEALEDVEPLVLLGETGPLVARLEQVGVQVEVFELSAPARLVRRSRITPGGVPLRAVTDAAIYTLRLARRLRQIRPHLVHTNSLKAALYGTVAGRLAGVPVVWHVHDRIAHDYLPSAATRLVRLVGGQLASVVVANSRETLSTVGAVRGRAVVIPYVIPQQEGVSFRDSQPLRVGIVGRIAPWKGQDGFLHAFASAFPGGREEAVVVGAPLFGEDDFERSLRDLVIRLGIEGRVVFRGFSENVDTELRALDILVHASVIPEPWGQVIAEGMAVGVPVIAAAAGGPAEIVEDGVSGVLYPLGDWDALATHLRTLASDRQLRQRLAAGGHERVRRFAPEVVATQVLAVYSETLAAGRVRR